MQLEIGEDRECEQHLDWNWINLILSLNLQWSLISNELTWKGYLDGWLAGYLQTNRDTQTRVHVAEGGDN